MTKDPQTIALYDRAAAEYARLTKTGWRYPRLEAFIDALPTGGHVLDLGCGPGIWAARMVERGLDVVALDASAGMAEVARERHGLDVRVAGFADVTEQDAYDGIWAHYSLLHAPRAEVSGYLSALARALRPGGRIMVMMKLGSGEARDSLDRFYSYYSEAELSDLLVAAGLAIEGAETGEDVGLDGQRHGFVALHARRM